MNPAAGKKKFPNRISKQSGKKVDTFQKTQLPNGIRIVSQNAVHAASFSLGICVNAGSREDPIGYNGAAHFIEHLLFRVSKHGTSKRLNGKFESVGAYANAYTAKEFTYYHTRALLPHFRKTFHLLSDTFLMADIKQKELEAERNVIIEEIKLYMDDPEEMIFDTGEEVLFGDHSLGKPIAGTIESVSAINAEALRKYYNDYYAPQNIIIAAVGNIQHSRLVELVEPIYVSIRNPEVTSNRELIPFINPKHITYRKQVQQAYLLMATRIPGVDSSLKYPLILLNELFCDGMSSRLQDKIRDKYGLAYSVESDIYFYSDVGTMYITAVTDRKNIARVKEMIIIEMRKLLAKGIFRAELYRAKEQLKSSLIIENENLSSRMRAIFRSELYGSEPEKVDDAISEIGNVDMEDIQRAIEMYFEPSAWSSITVLPE